ncbi:MAG: FHA domain-containing protein [Deltaproteobacteria bacterium]|nr:FHA domain-containing protein [Deltaproteobacteria bacterium]
MAVVATLGIVGPAHAANVNFDRFDGSAFTESGEKKGYVRFFIDVLDDNDDVVPDKQINDVKVFVDNQELKGRYELRTVADENPVSVAILVAAHESFAWPDDPNREESVIMEQTKLGYKAFLEKLTDNVDWSTIWYYNEEGVKKVASWGQRKEQAIDNLKLIRRGEKGVATAPALYNAVKRVMDDIQENDQSISQRRLLIVMSDGKDRYLEKTSLVERKIQDIAEVATSTHAKVIALGFSPDIPEPLVYLGTLAKQTNGRYREVKVEEVDDISRAIARTGEQVKNQYVLDFWPEDYSGSEQNVNVRLELETSAGPGKTVIEGVKWPEKPFNIMPIIIIVCVVLGSLLGIFLLVKLFKAMAKRRANRPVAVVEEEGPVGPYKGKLTCTQGAYAGAEFYLTEDVTTIGSIDGNTIVIQEAGVSKRHAGIKIEDMRFELADFGSTNGTLVNGNKVTKQFLRDQDIIRIGECHLKFTLK